MDGWLVRWGWSTPLTESYFISLFAQEKGRGRCRQLWVDGLRLCTHLEAFFKVKYTEKTNSFCLAQEFVLNASCPSTTATTCGIIRRIRGCSSVSSTATYLPPSTKCTNERAISSSPAAAALRYPLCTTQMLLWSSVGRPPPRHGVSQHIQNGFVILLCCRSQFRSVGYSHSVRAHMDIHPVPKLRDWVSRWITGSSAFVRVHT